MAIAEKCVYTHLKMHLSLADRRQKSSKRRSSSNETKIVGKAMQKTRSFRGVIRILRWLATLPHAPVQFSVLVLPGIDPQKEIVPIIYSKIPQMSVPYLHATCNISNYT